MSDTTATLWGQIAAERNAAPQIEGWLDSPLIQQLYVRPLTGMVFTGGEDVWLRRLVEQLQIPRTGRWLSIGCGSGGWELFAAEQGLCAEIEGVDIAPEAIAMAQRAAVDRGITNAHFRVADVERSRLPERSYDVVLGSMGLHHVERLEFFYAEAANALRPSGWMLLNEFVGPSRWQWSDGQLTAINTLLAALPARYRVITRTGKLKEREERPSIEFMKHLDPSESVRAADILPLLREQFTVVDQRDYGGPVLHKLLESIVGNFRGDRPEDVALLQLLCASEQALIKTGALQHDFTFVAARNDQNNLRSSQLPFDAHEIERHVVSGIYPIERGPRGRSFCWTAPDAMLVLDRPPTARVLTLVLALPPVLRCLTVSVDGITVGVLRSNRRTTVEPWRRVSFRLPLASSRQPTIRLHLDHPWSPADVWGGDDSRALGVALAGAAYR